MKTSRFLFAGALLCAAASYLGGADWPIKDGRGSTVLKDASPDKTDLVIATPDTVTWAWEDDRRSFLNFSGGSVTGPAEKLLFPDGLTLEIAFSANLRGGREWLPLVTCGNSFQNGYSLWVRRNGQLLVCLSGTSKGYMLLKTRLENLRDYTVKVVRDRRRARVLLDGKVIADFPCTGKIKHTPGEPFRLGSTPKWKFYGNIYYVKLRAFREGDFDTKAAVEEKITGAEIKPVKGIVDPEGTVVRTDLYNCTPRPRTGGAFFNNVWTFRRGSMFPPPSEGTLHCCDNPDEVSITYDPKLAGVYDIYFGLRATCFATDLMVRLPGVEDAVRVRIAPVEQTVSAHENTEVLLARDVKMDGGKLTFLPGGQMYLGYIKFIPSANRRKTDYPKWKCVSVTPAKADFRELAAKRIRSRIAKGYFVERKFVDGKKVPAAGETAQKLGVIVNAHDWMDLLFENAVPAKDPGKVALKAAAAPGEHEPACLSVFGLRDAGKVSLSGGNKLKKAGIVCDIAVVRSLPKRSTNIYGPSEFVYGPQYLERVTATQVKKGMSKQFWITFKVPGSAKAGTYEDTFVLTTPGGRMEIPVSVTVRSFKLDRPTAENVGLWGTGLENYPEKASEYRDRGCNVITMHPETDLLLAGDRFDRIGESAGAKFIEELKGQLRSVVISTHPLTRHTYGRPGGEEKFRKAVRQVMDYAKAHGWPKVYFYIQDEALSNPTTLKYAIWESKRLRECGVPVFSTHLWYKTSRPYQKEVDEIAPLIDAFCNRYSTRSLWYVDKWDEMQKRALAEGKELWSYNADRALIFAQPAMKRFACGWFFRTVGRGCVGQLIFTYFRSVESPYTELDGEDGECVDFCYIYPAGKGHAGGYAIDLEGIREGIDDLRYIVTLENRIAEAKKKGLASEAAAAEKVLAGIAGSFDFGPNYVKNTVFLDSPFEKSWEENGKRYCSGVRNLPNGWRFEDYHKAREKIAGEIVKLDKVLKK